MIFESWFWKREISDLIADREAWAPRHMQDHNEDFWFGESGFFVERGFVAQRPGEGFISRIQRGSWSA